MSHEHKVFDTDDALVIDAINKTITNPTGSKIVLAQYDHNSQRVTCKIPRYIEDHDMLKCDEVQIHYDNVSSGTSVSTRSTNSDVYDVPDLAPDPKDEDTLICTWLISQNATQYAGVVKFKLKFICYGSDQIADYVWNTNPSTDIIEVYAGFDNANAIIEQYADIIEQWRQSLVEAAPRYKGFITEEELDLVFDKDAGDIYIVEYDDGHREFAMCIASPSGDEDAVWFNTLEASTIRQMIDTLYGDIEAVAARVDENTSSIALLNAAVDENSSNIDLLNTAVDKNTSDITLLSNAVGENTESITQLSDLIGKRPLRYVGMYISKTSMEGDNPKPKDGDVALVVDGLGNHFYMWDSQYKKWYLCGDNATPSSPVDVENMFQYKGIVTGSRLTAITDQKVGDTYFVEGDGLLDGCFYTWDGSAWKSFDKTPSTTVTEGDNNAVTAGAVYDFVMANSGGNTGGITEETDPTVPDWAKQPTKPTYTADEVGAMPADAIGVMRFRGVVESEPDNKTFSDDRRVGDTCLYKSYSEGRNDVYVWGGTYWTTLNLKRDLDMSEPELVSAACTVPTSRAVSEYVSRILNGYQKTLQLGDGLSFIDGKLSLDLETWQGGEY